MLHHSGDPQSSCSWMIHPGLSPPLYFPTDVLPIYSRGSVYYSPGTCPDNSVLLNFFPFLLQQPSRSSNISHVMYQPSLLQMPSKFLLAANFKAQLLEMKGVRVKTQTQLWVNVSKWTPLLLLSFLFSAGDFLFSWVFALQADHHFSVLYHLFVCTVVWHRSVCHIEERFCSPRRGVKCWSNKYLCSSDVVLVTLDISSLYACKHIWSLLGPCASTHWSSWGRL